MNIPNQLTLLRILLIPVFVLVFYSSSSWNNYFACLVFALAALTDILDGYLARKLNQTSSLGAFLDPVADKLMVAVVLVLVVQQNPTTNLALPAAIIIGREITVSALREWMAEVGIKILSETNHKRLMELQKEYENGCLDKQTVKGIATEHQSMENIFDQIMETYKDDDHLIELDK